MLTVAHSQWNVKKKEKERKVNSKKKKTRHERLDEREIDSCQLPFTFHTVQL